MRIKVKKKAPLKTDRLQVRLDKKLAAKVKKLCKKNGFTLSDLIRASCENFVDEQEHFEENRMGGEN